MNDGRSNSIDILRGDIKRLREGWRKVKAAKLKRKTELQSLGYDNSKIRRDRVYKSLRKEQKRISKEIKHKLQAVNRKLSIVNKN